MTGKLKQYFPMIQTRKEVLGKIKSSPGLLEIYEKWSEEQQTEFLDMCTGMRGVKILYDSFFKLVLDPENVPERLDDFLSLLLKKKVRIVKVLPRESGGIADETSLVVMDIIVEMEDRSLINVEVQKVGYMFPGQRCACYSADLLLRQYKRVRSGEKKKFSYRDIKTVYTIVLFEKSPAVFHSFSDAYLHHFFYKSDTGLELDLLQEYLFVPLDIFRKVLHNKGISNRLDAWLAFLCMDEPEVIIKLIETYPEFKPFYEDIYRICLNIEGVMDMFSKELQKLDQNTVQYMIDELQETIDRQKAEMEKKRMEAERERRERIAKEQEAEQERQRRIVQEQEAEKERLEAENERQKRLKTEEELEAALRRITELEQKTI